MIKSFIGVTLVTMFILRFPVRVARETANFFTNDHRLLILAAFKWLEFGCYGVKPFTINQSIMFFFFNILID